MPSDEQWDAVVVGGGPAGLAAATWLARYRRRTVVIDGGKGRNASVDHSHGYLTRDGAPPAELLAAARADLSHYSCVDLRSGEVESVTGEEGDFTVRCAGGDEVRAQRVVLCTGVIDATPDIAGFDEHYGASVFHCPSCDGYEARERDVVVLGWSEHVAGFALELLDWAATVTVVTDGRRFEGDDVRREALDRNGVTLLEDEAVAFVGTRGDLRAIHLRGGTEIPCTLAFFSIGHTPRTGLADALGCERSPEGYVLVDEHGETSVPGVFAAGDLVPGFQLIQVATAKGTTAGVGCALALRRDPPPPASPPRAPDIPTELGEDETPEDEGA
jgi:thioredoxin reductase